MGLDITAISHITPTLGEEDVLLGSIGLDTEKFYVHPHFASKVSEFKDYVEDDCVTFMQSDESKTHSFSAGSYSTHNQFKNEICKMILGISLEEFLTDIPKYKGKPFFEFLDMSDCNGSIGPNAAKECLTDFVNHKDKFCIEREDGDKWMNDAYNEWIGIFTLAAQDGIVMFH